MNQLATRTYNNVQAIVLAAGASSRFKTGTTKLAYPICGQEMILYPLRACNSLQIPITIVVGHQKELVQSIVQRHYSNITFIEQQEQRGTGHAVAMTKQIWSSDHILVMNGDMPLITSELIEAVIHKHHTMQAAITFVTAHTQTEQHGYGRVQEHDGHIKIIEERDLQKKMGEESCCINAGLYLFKREILEQYIHQLTTHNDARAFYLTDIIALASKAKLPVIPITAPFDTIRGVNTLKQLWAVEHIKRSELIEYWMEQGVQFHAPHITHIDFDVTIGAGTSIGAAVQIKAGSRIGNNCTIEAGTDIERSIIADHVIIKPYSIIKDSTINTSAQIGPYAHIRNHSIVGTGSIIGNYVEMSASTIATKTKIKHVSYIGNAQIGSHINIGAGTVICNYNGMIKQTTTIEDHAFIGANNSLVAPLTIGNHAITAAGSTITNQVPAHALAIGRSRQINKEGYAQQLRSTAVSNGTQQTPVPSEP